MPYGEQSLNIGRNAWLQAGLPIETPATTIDRQCGSAQQAVNFGAALVASRCPRRGHRRRRRAHGPHPDGGDRGDRRGVREFYPPELLERYDLIPQGLSAELIAETWGISREECDAFALRSQERAARAAAEGRFDREIVPVGVNGSAVTADQGIRPETTLEGLASLKPAFKEDGRHTPGTRRRCRTARPPCSSSRESAEANGLPARARIVDHLTVGVDPVMMLTGPIPATARILERNGLTLDEIDLVEVNEAFASVVLAWEREHGPEMERVNVNGGAIALGHPLGSTGARLLTTLLHELERTGGRLGLVTMCCGGGLGTATLIERLD